MAFMGSLAAANTCAAASSALSFDCLRALGVFTFAATMVAVLFLGEAFEAVCVLVFLADFLGDMVISLGSNEMGSTNVAGAQVVIMLRVA